MPKYGVHQVVLANAINGLSASGTEAGHTLAQNYDLAMLGAIGPDLFFWAPDYEVVRTLKGIYEAIDAVIQAYDDVVQPINDLIDDVGDKVEEVLPATYAITETFIDSLKATISAFEKTMTTGALATALGGVNLLTDAASLPSLLATLFAEFTPPRQFNEGEDEWYWFDMLHYRNTGDFARHLVENARRGTDRQRAYAFGYLSHIATDLTGHPYVNQIVGGPFRLHVQRHVIVENFIDSWIFREEYDESINQTLIKRLGLTDLDGLPDEIVKLIDGAFRATYTDKRTRPDFLTAGQIRETYDNLYLILGYMERLAIPYPTEPFSDVGRILSDALEDLLEPPPNPPPNPFTACSFEDIFSFGTTPNSRSCYDAFFRQLERYFEYIGQLLEWLFETVMDLADLLLAALASLPLSVGLAFLYAIQVGLYDIYQTLRYALVLGGLVYPEPDDLNSSHGRNLTTTFQECIPDLVETYPNQAAMDISPLICPPLQLERPPTVPGFSEIASSQVTPFEFIRDVPFVLDDFLPYARGDAQDTETLHHQHRRVGNAIGLTQWMIAVASDGDAYAQYKDDVFANFDLDADRGYFHKTWEGKIEPDRVRGFRYI